MYLCICIYVFAHIKENQSRESLEEVARVNIYHLAAARTVHHSNSPELRAFKWRFWRKVAQFGQFSHFRGGRVRPGGPSEATEADSRKRCFGDETLLGNKVV